MRVADRLPAHVDVLIVNYRTGELTVQAAEAVASPGVHVWVHDNSGELLDGPCPAAFTGLVGDGSNRMYAPANNTVAQCCNGEWVLLLNPDVVLDRTGLARMVEELAARPEAWGVAPRLLNEDGSDQRYLHRLPDLRALLADRIPPLRRLLRRSYQHYLASDVDLRLAQVVEQPPAACLLLRRSALGERIFDERYALFFNDTDLARRLNKHGECWYLPEVTALHLRGESFRREKPSRGYHIARLYDRALLGYARQNVRGWMVLIPVVAGRLALSRVLDRLRRASAVPVQQVYESSAPGAAAPAVVAPQSHGGDR